jgi:hypothetical protein
LEGIDGVGLKARENLHTTTAFRLITVKLRLNGGEASNIECGKKGRKEGKDEERKERKRDGRTEEGKGEEVQAGRWRDRNEHGQTHR